MGQLDMYEIMLVDISVAYVLNLGGGLSFFFLLE